MIMPKAANPRKKAVIGILAQRKENPELTPKVTETRQTDGGKGSGHEKTGQNGGLASQSTHFVHLEGTASDK